MKDIQIEWVTIRTAKTIKVDGKVYPRNQRNLDVAREYDLTQDESVLNRLVDFSLDLA